MIPHDRVLFLTDLVTVGEFRCPVDHPRFRNSGPIRQSCIVFPRTSVVIEHDGKRPFVSDTGLATLYNTGQHYERRPISPDGDRCDWYAIATELLCEVVRPLDPAAADDPPRAVRHLHAPVSAETYLEQRRLFTSLQDREPIDDAEVEERVLTLVARVLNAAYERPASGATSHAGERATRQRREIAQAARQTIARMFNQRLSLNALARRVGCSPFHLCRSFQADTGTTVHAHLTTLRLRSALERIGAGEDLTSVALDTGFSSHSHFSMTFRRAFGVIPSSAVVPRLLTRH